MHLAIQDVFTLTGVIRPPALLTTKLTLLDIGCPKYEIAMCEPLHDFKNVIERLLTELPLHITDATLKADIAAFCKDVLGIVL